MFIEDIKNDFYNVILGNRVLLLVHYDVDAVCSCKILQGLFKCDNIPYTLVPVGGVSELKKAFDENNEEIKYVVLVNCGGTIDIVDILQPEEDVVFFVLDSHKPTDVCNVYSDGQVRLVYKDSEENIPNFDDIFRDDEDEESEEPEPGREGLEALVERRRARRQWEERRHTLMFSYTQFSYFGKASAIVCYELAWRLSRAGTAALWAGCVAAAWQEEVHARDRARAVLDTESLMRSRPPEANDAARVVLQKDLTLPLYRSWSLEEAITHAPALAPALRLHNALAGASRVRALLAATGIPLQQARQAYRSMDVDLRRSLLTSLEAAATQLKLPSVCRSSFVLETPHAATVADIDVMYSIMALIEHEHLPPGEGFQLALASLSLRPGGGGGADGAEEARARGGTAARRALAAAATLAHGVMASKRLCLAGPFSYFIVQEGTPEAAFVRGPHWLGLVARWVAALGGARALLASAPCAGAGGRCLLLGVPPRQSQEPRNLFGAAFSTAAARCGASVQLDFFDASVISLPHEQRPLFLDALTALLS